MSEGPEPLQPGDRVERYRIEALLGEGATARVFRVQHELLGTRHALKVLQGELASQVDRIMQEARVQARLQHPNIVTVRDVLAWQGRPCLVMDLVDGPSLEALLVAQGPLPWRQALDLLRPVVEAVALAHAQGVLHRDIKPANVLVEPGPPPRARITDFGLAKVGSEDRRQGQTRRQVAMGTPGFMAPEQWADAAGVDARADVFGLAATLYASLTGRAPFVGEATACMAATVAGQFPPVDELVACPARLAAAVARGLAPDPAARWPSVEALSAELALLGDAEALVGAPPLPGTLVPEDLHPVELAPLVEGSAPPPSRLLPAAMLGAGLLGLGAVGGVGWVLVGRLEVSPLVAEDSARVVELPAMSFWRGDTFGDGAADERPVERVELAAFAIASREVSTAEYLDCVGAGACTAPVWQEDPSGYEGLMGPQQPIVGVRWDQARDYCAFWGGRLPTEVEWEAAATWWAQAEGPEDKRRWPWGEEAPDCGRARFQGCGEGTVEVGSLDEGASAFGLEGMAGNVWEWTASTYPVKRGLFRRSLTHYVLRGGAFDSQPAALRPTFRRHTAAGDARPNTGLRCAR